MKNKKSVLSLAALASAILLLPSCNSSIKQSSSSVSSSASSSIVSSQETTSPSSSIEASSEAVSSSSAETQTSSSDAQSSSEEQKTYFSFTFKSSEGCTAMPLDGYDPSMVEQGKDFKFKITVPDGYSVTGVAIDNTGFSIMPDEDGVYTIRNVQSNIIITCTASINTFRINFGPGKFKATASEGCDPHAVPYGNDYSFTLKADDHNKITGVFVNETALTPNDNGVYTIKNVKATTFVSVETEEETYSLTLPEENGFTIEAEDKTLDLASIPYSKEVKLKITPEKYHRIDDVKLGDEPLTKGDDGYYLIKNKEGSLSLSVSSSLIKCQITYDTFGAGDGSSLTQDAGTTLEEPTSPTKTLDDYYDSVSFDGWYSKDGKHDFSLPLEDDLDLIANYSYGKAKTTVAKKWNDLLSDFEFVNGASASTNYRGSFNGATWSQYGGKEGLDTFIADFNRTSDDGVLIASGDDDAAAFALPKINFNELLSDGKVAYMEAGTYNTHNTATLNGVKVLANQSDSSVQVYTSLRNVLVSFKLTSDNKVHAYFKNVLAETPFSALSNPGAEVTLTDAQASGEEGLRFLLYKGTTRLYWFGNLYTVNAEREAIDFSSASNLTLENAAKKEATKLAVQSSKDGLTFEGNGATNADKTVLTLDPIKLDEDYFAKGEGLRFTLGSSSGQEKIAWVNGEQEISLGESAEALSSVSTQTREQMVNTMQNWEFNIVKAGAFITNKAEGKTYFAPLEKEALSGKAGIKIRLSCESESTGKGYTLSNVTAFKA